MKRVLAAFAATIALIAAAPASPIALISQPALLLTIAGAKSVYLTTYLLDPRSRMVESLAIACARGAQVELRLAHPDRDRFVLPRNIETAARLVNGVGFGVPDQQSAAFLGIAPRKSRRSCNLTFDSNPLHAKLAYVDGRAYLSDENFTSRGYIVRDDVESDRSVIASTLRGQPTNNGRLSTVKRSALALEANLIYAAREPLDVASEAFGPGNPVADALLIRAGAIRIRLLVAQREAVSESRSGYEERSLLLMLRDRGVDVRLSPDNEKLATSGSLVWLGSSNATRQVPDQVDWGLAVVDSELAGASERRFQVRWTAAQPLPR